MSQRTILQQNKTKQHLSKQKMSNEKKTKTIIRHNNCPTKNLNENTIVQKTENMPNKKMFKQTKNLCPRTLLPETHTQKNKNWQNGQTNTTTN